MGQRAAAALSGRPFLYWVAVIVVAACIVSGFAIGAARTRMDQNSTNARSLQRLRAAQTQADIENFLADSSELARIMSETVGGVRNDRVLANRLVLGLLRSHVDKAIFGLGFYFAPGVFDGRPEAFAPYAYVDPRGAVVPAVTGNTGPRMSWVRFAQRTPNRVAFFGPYPALGKSGFSALEAVYKDGRFVGLASVDTQPADLVRIINRSLGSSDVAAIVARSGREILGTGSAGPTWVTIDLPLQGASAHLRLATDMAPIARENRRIATALVGVLVGLWALVVLLSVLVVRAWYGRRATLALELEQERLQGEIATRIEVEKRLREAAYVDALTALPNRGFFLERLSLVLSVPEMVDEFSVLYIDLDRFNLVNDTHGHPTGDELLKRVGARLLDALPPEAVIARLGGDEFAVLIHGGASAAMRHAAQVLELMRLPILLRERDVYLTASIGIVLLDSTYREPQDVLRDADIAMYEAKARGRNAHATFDTIMRRRLERESQLGHDLRRGIEQRQFLAHYQSVVDLASGNVASFEALARWKREDELVGAAAFITYAEQQGLVGEIDELVFSRVCADLDSDTAGNVPIAVNISAAHLTDAHLVTRLRTSLERHRIPPNRIKLELTETAIMSNAERALHTLQQLRDLGMEIVVDDFGTGHSSLAYLQRLPISGVKIDRSFIRPIEHDQQAVAIVRSIVALADALRLYTVAEGVENEMQFGILRELGVRYGQGFFFSYPVPAERVAESLARRVAS